MVFSLWTSILEQWHFGFIPGFSGNAPKFDGGNCRDSAPYWQ
jgi:hypothetical protein